MKFLQKVIAGFFTVLLSFILIFCNSRSKPENFQVHPGSAFESGGCDDAAKKDMESRERRIQNICKKHHLGQFNYQNGSNDVKLKDPPIPQYSYFLLHRMKRIAWCPVYKAGSTSWLHNMLLMAGVSEAELKNPPNQFSIWAREIYGEPEPGIEFENSLKLLIVRHPFSRILSAYRDKLSNSSRGHEHGTEHFYSKYGQNIVKKFRTDFSIPQKEPTFQEFVRYLIKTDFVYFDDHWLPVYYTCTPCLLQYKLVAKLETFTRDQSCIIHQTNLSSLLKPKWKHKTSSIEGFGFQKYFGELKKSQIQQLYQKYLLDFLLFDYEYESFLHFGREG